MNRTHHEKVADLSKRIATFHHTKTPFKVYHGSTNSTRVQVFSQREMLDTSSLNQILTIDPERKLALVEPNVPMDKLIRATLQHGLIPPVVPEFPGITVGGAVQGGGGESGSFRWGMVHQICSEYEMIIGDGTVVTCSPTQQSDLFYGTPGSYGTLGVMTAIKIQLIPAKKYVHLMYLPVRSFSEAVERLKVESSKKHDFIDGCMFSRSRGVIMVGTLTNKKQAKLTRFSRARDEWFYLEAKKESIGNARTKLVPLTDYLFRYDRGGFWVGAYAFERFNVPFTRFWRWLLNPMLHTRQLYEALQESHMSQHHLVQDLALPLDTAVKYMEFINDSYAVYPLWLCPIKPDAASGFMPNQLKTPLVINIGVWGSYIPSYQDFLHANHAVESKLAKLGGRKWFYAHAYYTEKDFWHIYDRKTYDTLREKYHTTHLPDIYEKVHVHERYPVDARRGVWRTLLRTARLKIEP